MTIFAPSINSSSEAMINKHFQHIILQATGASSLEELETIQNLWSGYGRIVRIGLKDSDYSTVVVKHVRLPENDHHPRGWNTDLSHQRKLHSYQVETHWYEQWSHRCDAACRIPQCLALKKQGDEVLMVLEDMDESGFPERKSAVTWDELTACIKWLANFHANFLGEKPTGLWTVGTYWHLNTRPDELKVLTDKPLKNSARAIDQLLQDSPFQTLVHGDAKLANFCFSPNGKQVAAVDFQYVGGGCGMKDLAYFIGSCLYEEDCEQLETQLLDTYFDELRQAIARYNKPQDADEVEANWRALFPVAWTDFHRFLKGWSPGHWKINSYSERLARQVVKQLNQ